MIQHKLLCRTYINYLLFGVLLGVFLFHYFFPEFVQTNNSIDWDANRYTILTKHFPELVSGQKINSYYFPRILPSAIIHYTYAVFSVPLTEINIRTGFLGLNVLLIIISFFGWLSICQILKLSIRNNILGFSGLFLNYAVLKMPFYYPVLTDMMAFMLGMLMLICYLKNYAIGILLIALLGAFTFPTLLYSGLLLYVFPMESPTDFPVQKSRRVNRIFPLAVTIIFLLLIVAFYFYRKVPLINPNTDFVLSISILAALVYIYSVSGLMIQLDFYIKALSTFNRWNRLVIAILCVCVVMAISWTFSSSEPSIFNYKGFLANIVIVAIANPWNFLVAHAVYLGPVFFLLLYYANTFIYSIEKYGLGLHLFIFGYALLSVYSESRLFINAWPFFITFLCIVLEKERFSNAFYCLMLLLSLVWSKFWFRINSGAFTGNYFAFPDQRYFMSQGPWMSDTMFLMQGALSLLISSLIYFLFLKKKTGSFTD